MADDNTKNAYEGLGCAFIILAIGISVTLIIWAASGFPGLH